MISVSLLLDPSYQTPPTTASTHLLVPVEGVDDELHHTVDLCLEDKLLRLFSQLLHLGHAQSIQLDRLLLSIAGQ